LASPSGPLPMMSRENRTVGIVRNIGRRGEGTRAADVLPVTASVSLPEQVQGYDRRPWASLETVDARDKRFCRSDVIDWNAGSGVAVAARTKRGCPRKVNRDGPVPERGPQPSLTVSPPRRERWTSTPRDAIRPFCTRRQPGWSRYAARSRVASNSTPGCPDSGTGSRCPSPPIVLQAARFRRHAGDESSHTLPGGMVAGGS